MKPCTVVGSPFRNRRQGSTTCAIRSPSAPEPAAPAIETPRVERRVVAPVAAGSAPEMADLPQLAGLDHLPREPHRRNGPVVERAEVLDACRLDRVPDVVALAARRGQVASRSTDVLAGTSRGDRRLGVERVRPAVVEQPMLSSSTSRLELLELRNVIVAASSTASTLRLAMPTSFGSSGGGDVCRQSATRSSAPRP